MLLHYILFYSNKNRKILHEMMELDYDKSRLFLDEDCSAPDKFTVCIFNNFFYSVK